MNSNKAKILYFLLTTAIISSFWSNRIMADLPLEEKLKGKILLQVEENGEAWYVYPEDQKRYFLGRPKDAFDLMQDLGRGISNEDLKKIPVAQANFLGIDTDGDGLSDKIEESFGTDINNKDTDGDSFDDKTEILGAYNPFGEGEMALDENIQEKLAGFIVLQVENNGEAWYISPEDKKRYFLGSPKDAFSVMRNLGLGVTNENIDKIAKVVVAPEYITKNIVENQTKEVESNTLVRRYTSEDGYSFEYPSAWRIRKFPDSPKEIQITDAKSDFISEKKAVITIHNIQTEQDYQVSDFKVAMTDVDVTEKDIEIKEKEGFEREIEYKHAYSKTAIIKINDRNYLRISLTLAEENDSYIERYDSLIESLEFF